MLDAVKDYLVSKRFGVVSYVCLIAHFLCGLILIPVTSVLRASETGKFSCAVDTKSTAVYRTYVEKTCYSRYGHAYNSPLPLYAFVLLSFGLQVLVSVIYSLAVSSRVDEIADRTENGSERPRADGDGTRTGFYVFYSYFFHLVVRSVFGILFTVLQHTVFYPRGFGFKFSCSLPTSKMTSQIATNSSAAQFNGTLIACENSTASEKELWGIIVSILNTVFALIILGEVIYLWRRFPILNRRSELGWNRDTEFVTVHLLRKRYTPVDVERRIVDNNTPPQSHSTRSDRSSQDSSIGDSIFPKSLEFYKRQVLHPSRTSDICYAPETDLDDVYIDVIIHTGRAQHKFSKEMDRHEIYDVYMEVPKTSIRLEEIKDLFYPNEDTKGKSPRTILAVGRPGIGKTVLTEKVIRDWANEIDEFYHGKIAFYVKFRWFSSEELKNMSLKTFLLYGTGLSEEKFERFFQEILSKPEKAILIFDGLDEFDGEFIKCLDQARMLSNDHNTPMSPMTLFIKLAFGNMLHGATILVTSRPTADEFYSKLHFDRSVEIIGFTSEKIQEYVSRFCSNKNVGDLKPKIWNHIESSSDLLNLCYIPVNCYIVCVTLSGCLINSNNDTGALPTTMTALYQTAVDHFAKRHNRNLDKTSSEQMLEKLEKLAFDGMKNGQLIFKENKFDAQMRKSGLVNSLSNPVSPLQTQFCFIHLTIHEFLAAKHVIETLAPDEIKKFISTHIKSGKWHLVLQFIAGLLGEKIKMSDNDYQDCVFAFAEGVTILYGKINLDNYRNVFMMKCLREMDDEDLVKKVCEKTALNHVSRIFYGSFNVLSSSDWAAVTCIGKHLINLIDVCLKVDVDIHLMEVGKLLKQRCLETLAVKFTIFYCTDEEKQQLVCALTESNCALNHEHKRLREICLRMNMTDAHLSNICTFIRNGNADCVEEIDLRHNKITSFGVSHFCAVLHDQHCGQLTYLNFAENPIGDEGVRMLCNALMQGNCKINTLVLILCSLTAECVRWLSAVLLDEDCKLTYLNLSNNQIGDEGVRMLCTDALISEQCKLTQLELDFCRLTDQCVPLLCATLQDSNCRLLDLSICIQNFTEHGKNLLRGAEKVEICKARGLKISI